jgi:hypothetical protein
MLPYLGGKFIRYWDWMREGGSDSGRNVSEAGGTSSTGSETEAAGPDGYP